MSNISLVQIINHTHFDGVFTNLETPADDMAINAGAYTNTPGQYGEGCHIPDCTGGKWWDEHRMTILLGKTILSLWKEGSRVYYRADQTVYPGEGRGEFLWEDNGLPVVLSISHDIIPTITNP